jgi:hypothetical protein
MVDGTRILNEATGIAFPRYPGSAGDTRAIRLIEKRFDDLGLETSLEWFSYDLTPANRALRVTLIAGALWMAFAGIISQRSPILGLAFLTAALLPGGIFLAWAPWLESLYHRDGNVRTANIIGRHGPAEPRLSLLLMAHHDSKSQSLTFPFRMGLTLITILGTVVLLGLMSAGLMTGRTPGPPLLPALVGGAVAAAMFGLSTMKSRNSSPGGVDNAGSVAILFEAARELTSTLPEDIELIFLSTGAEEDHMIGAMRWLEAHAGEFAGRPVYCMNFDGAGAPGRVVLIERFGFGKKFSEAMSAAARRAAARLGITVRGIVMLPGMGIDAIPFAHRGLQCLTLSSGSLDRATMAVHSANDVAEHLDAETLAEVASLAVETLKELTTTIRPLERQNVKKFGSSEIP